MYIFPLWLSGKEILIQNLTIEESLTIQAMIVIVSLDVGSLDALKERLL